MPHLSDPSEIASTREEVHSIRSAMCKLPPEQRSALQLAFFEGMTHEEIAEAQSVPLGTAKTRIRSAMRKLREFLSAPAESKVAVSS